MAANRLTYKLKEPIQFGDETITEFAFRKPKAKDFRGLDTSAGAEMDLILKLAGRLSGQVDAVIDGLDWEDLEEVLTLVGGFIPTRG